MAATERHGRFVLAFGSPRVHRATRVRGTTRSLSAPRDVTSGCAVLNQWPIPTKGITAGSAGRDRGLFHRLRADCAKSHRFAPDHEAGASTVVLAAIVTYEAPGRQR